MEVPLVTAKGRPIWARLQGHVEMQDGQPVRLLGLTKDITERRAARLALQQSEARYRALFEHAPDGIVIADSQSTYLDANASICRSHQERNSFSIACRNPPLFGPSRDGRLVCRHAARRRRCRDEA